MRTGKYSFTKKALAFISYYLFYLCFSCLLRLSLICSHLSVQFLCH